VPRSDGAGGRVVRAVQAIGPVGHNGQEQQTMATDVRESSTLAAGDALGEINKYDFRTDSPAVFKASRGLSADIVSQISEMKKEPRWMRDFRLKSLEIFNAKPLPRWGGDIGIDFQDIYYYLKPADHQGKTWDDVPAEIKKTFERLGIPEAERKYLSGVKAQFESEVVYGSLQEDLAKKGVIFTDTDTAVREYPDLVREYFATIIPPADNKFAALNSAVWSGGSFIYVPKGVKIDFPLQAYFRINAENMGQFERTLIIVDEGAQLHYVEGCTAPMYSTESLHSAVVEIIVKKHGRCRYTTIQNWANNIYNLVTTRAVAREGAMMEWIDGNLGSRLTMKYPAVYMVEPGARGEILSIAFSSAGQHQDAGAKLVHAAPNTFGRIVSKSISKNGGRSSYRGLVRVEPGARKSRSSVVCDALILDDRSRSDTYPYIEIEEQDVSIGHEASVSKIGEEQLFYLTSRGLSEAEASTMIVSGFIEPLVKELPMEYAVEMNRLIELQMEGSVG
jgi:Fe-S cluster assembly protein SufB